MLRAQSKCWPFLWDGFWYGCFSASGSEPAFFSERQSTSGNLSFDQKLSRERKWPSLDWKLGNQDVGYGARLKMSNFAIFTEITKICLLLCFRNRTACHQYRRLAKQVKPSSAVTEIWSNPQGKIQTNGSWPLRPQVTLLYIGWRTWEKWLLLISLGTFLLLQRSRSAGKGSRIKSSLLNLSQASH